MAAWGREEGRGGEGRDAEKKEVKRKMPVNH